MRRLSGYVRTLLQRIEGLSAVPPTARRWGPPHYDMDTDMQVEGPVSAPGGLGVARDFAYLNAHTTRRTKATCAGPLTFSGFCHLAPPYKDVWQLAHDVSPQPHVWHDNAPNVIEKPLLSPPPLFV